MPGCQGPPRFYPAGLPPRFRPGDEKRLSVPSRVVVYGMFGLGLAAGAMLSRRS